MVEEFVILERLVVCCGGGEYISGLGEGERQRRDRGWKIRDGGRERGWRESRVAAAVGRGEGRDAETVTLEVTGAGLCLGTGGDLTVEMLSWAPSPRHPPPHTLTPHKLTLTPQNLYSPVNTLTLTLPTLLTPPQNLTHHPLPLYPH